MNLRPYKFVVKAIMQTVDDQGNVIGEADAEPVVIFGCEELQRWAEAFPETLKSAELRALNP